MKYKIDKVKALPNFWVAINFKNVDSKVYKLYDVNLFAQKFEKFLALKNDEMLFRTVKPDIHRDGIIWDNGLYMPFSELWEEGIELLSINELWDCKDEAQWKYALKYYFAVVKYAQLEVEMKMENLNVEDVKKYSVEEFYNFLHDDYCLWKFLGNYHEKRQQDLEEYKINDEMYLLESIKNDLFNMNHINIYASLKAIERTKGLGVPAVSGLLAILFPKHFGTVDKMILRALKKVETLKEREYITSKDKVTSKDFNLGTLLIKLMRNKAKELNEKFDTDFWTPRKIDMILWSIGRDIQ